MTQSGATAEPAEEEEKATGPRLRVHLAELLAARGMAVGELAERIGIHANNVSRIKNGKVDGYRRSTLEAICRELECQPGDLLTYD
ncbi:helix-turn-helix domain-containing protein [Streptomyces sp. NPDC059783]|uniref:helix-turn-helix domain-containing protein n=1 Tax=Streptomyces sp. NPDC059783 TaxID=3346944 RepID=UPI00364674EC